MVKNLLFTEPRKKGGFILRGIIFLILLLLVTGCNEEAREIKKESTTQFVRYETEEKRNPREEDLDNSLKKYTQSEERGISKDGTKHEIFKTEESMEITQLLSRREDVRHAHVATSRTQVVAFVLLRDFQNPHIAKDLEEEIRTITPEKDIFIYTDKKHYNRIEDLKSSMGARQIGDNLQQFFEENLNIRIKN